jgi:adenylate kinase family enzyme
MSVELPPPGRRIVVVGTSGSGKTFVARALASRLGVPFFCNDSVIWGPGWTPTPKPLRFQRFDEATQGPGWTYDGNLGSLADPEDRLILARADTLVWLDLPRRTVMWQLLKRTIRRVWTHEELWHGNRESFRSQFLSRDSILSWAWRTHGLRRRQYEVIVADPGWSHLVCIRLHSRRQVADWLSGLAPAPGDPDAGRQQTHA